MTNTSILVSWILVLIAVHQGSDAAMLACKQVQVDECLAPFNTYLTDGVAILKDANDTFLAIVCMKYEMASSCVAPLMYYCPEIKLQLKSRLEDFEYACTSSRSGAHWPFKPTFEPSSADEFVDEAVAAEERKRIIDSAIKASVAAAVTIVLVLICVVADCVSKWKIRSRVKKAMSASAAQTGQEQLLLENKDPATAGEHQDIMDGKKV